jgi:hypothetical protein
MPLANYQRFAVKFTKALVVGDFLRAEAMLGPPLCGSMSANDLRERYEHMLSGYGETSQPLRVSFDPEFSSESWPEKQAADLGWAYVSILNDTLVEAVTVTVARSNNRLCIRFIAWGRP